MQKFLSILLSSVMFISFNSLGQGAVFNWAQNFTTPIDKMDVDSLSNIYSIGGGSITKRTSSGSLLWARSITEIRSLVVTSSGDVYITGGFTGTVNFNSWGAGYSMTSAGNKDIYVSKLNTNGDFVWAQRIGGVGADSATQISLDTLGHVYITGVFNGSVDFDPGPQSNVYSNGNSFMLKLDTAGNFIWARVLNILPTPNIQDGISLSQASKDGYLYCVGRGSNSDLNPGPGVYQSNVSADFMIKMDPYGNFVTAYVGQQFIAAPPDLFGMRVDANKNIFYIASDMTFGNLHNAVIIKHDSSCNYSGAITFSNTGVGNALKLRDIDIDSQNRIYATGFTYSNLVIGGQNYIMSGGGGFLICVGPSLNVNWVRITPTHGYCLSADNSCLYSSGIFGGTQNFNTPNSPYYLSAATGSTYILGVCNCSVYSNTMTLLVCDSTTISGITYNSSGQYNQLINNPNGCDTNLTLNLTINHSQFDTTYATSCTNYTFNGITYNTSGVFYQYYVAANLCDSIKVLYLDILQPSSSTLVQSSCGSYTLNGQTYNSSGLYTQTFTNAVSCDSTVYLYLTIYQNPLLSVFPFTDTTVCIGTSYMLYADSNFVSNQWTLNGNIVSYNDSLLVNSSGTYILTCVDTNGCYASDTVNIIMLPAPQPIIVQNGFLLTCTNVDSVNYQWFWNNNAIGTNDSILTLTQNGTYVVFTTDSSGCIGVDTIIVTGVWVDTYALNNQIQFYPNPTTSLITIYSAIPLIDATLRIYDMTGALLQEQLNLNESKFQLNLSNYANGLYQIELINQGIRYRSKVRKE